LTNLGVFLNLQCILFVADDNSVLWHYCLRPPAAPEYDMSFRRTLFLAVLVAAGAALLCAAPKPALVPAPGVWQLDFELHGHPQLISVTLPGQTEPRRFWYLLYTVTNNTHHDVEFYPQLDLLTDTLKLYHAGVKVRRLVFEAIRRRYDAAIPLLEPEALVTGRVLIGSDNARDSVAIFEDFDPRAGAAAIFVSGLSNETVTVNHPIAIDNKTALPKKVLLRKSLRLHYQVAGHEYRLDERAMLYRQRDWIMR